MESLSEKQIDQINDILVKQGVGYDELRNDLLDHICCMIEEGLARGQAFSNCLEEALDSFGMQNFKLIQESTLYLLNQKLKKMKKVVSILGLIASLMVIVGVVFRVNHIMGAGILLVLGVSVIALVVLPLLGYMTLVAKEDSSTIVTSLVGYFAAMSMAMGGLFKLMHWPFANILFWLGVGVLLLGFMPIYTLRSYRLAENKLFALTKSMLMLAGFVLLWSLSANTRIMKVEIPGGGMRQAQQH